MNTHMISAYEVALQELHTVASIMKLNDETIGFLAAPHRMIEVTIPLRLDNGTMKYFTGYRCQHNQALGPSRGGTRLHAEETMDDVKALALWMTVKNSLAGIPSGGGKGGIAVNPDTLSVEELNRLCRGYIRAIYPVIGPDVDVLGPDIGTPPSVMGVLMDEYENITQHHVPTSVSGKPLLLGGSEGRTRASGYGLVCIAEALLRHHNTTLEGKKIAIQGFGNLGYHAAATFAERGALVVAITNSRGGIYNPKGIQIEQARAHVDQGQSLGTLPSGDAITPEEIWALPCDILVPCALQNAINKNNAASIKAKFIIEGANGPVTPNGERILLENGAHVVPGVAANCGGVLVSYFEQVQNRYCMSWPEEKVLKRMEYTMTKSFKSVCHMAAEQKVSLRIAAWMIALHKVVEAMRLRGWVK